MNGQRSSPASQAAVLAAAPVVHGDVRMLERLYRASALVAGFERVELTLPRVLAVLAEAFPICTSVLAVRSTSGRRTYAWKGERVATRRMVDAERHAWEMYRYLVSDEPEDDEEALVAERLPGASACTDLAPYPYVCLPLSVSFSAPLGVFQLETPHTLSPTELRFVNVVVDLLALALARELSRRAEREARREAEHLAGRISELQRLAEVLLQSQRLDDALPQVMERIAALFHAEIGVVLLAQEGNPQLLEVRAAVGLPAGAPRQVPMGGSIAGKIASGGAMLFEDLTDAPDAGRHLMENHVRALIGAPLRVHGKVTGVVEVGSRQHSRFTDDDLRLLEFVAARIAVALEHARLFDLEQSFRRSLEEISAATVRISDALVEVTGDPSRAARSFEVIADAARRVTHAEHAGLCAYEAGAQPRPPLVSGPDDRLSRDERHRMQAAALLRCVARAPLPVREQAPHSIAKPALGALYPPIGPFLGVNARYRGRMVGSLYVARAPGAPPFTSSDQRVLELLAAHAGVALETARLTAELARERVQLGEGVRMRELMTAIVSHDLKNPLAAIRMTCDLLLHDKGASLISQQARPHLERIRRSADRMRQLTQDLLDVSRIEAGQLAVNLESVRAQGLVEEVVDQYAPLAAQKSLELRRHVPEPGLEVIADRERMGQALGNLVGNAIKFTASGSVTVSAERRGGEVWFSVADTGPGIAPDHLPHIFDRYWQAEATSRAGSGLGLSIAKGIAERHGGRIWAASELGAGATFFIALPLHAPGAATRAAPLGH